jgi:uncharacterized protein YjbI with pentapeptide repeats
MAARRKPVPKHLAVYSWYRPHLAWLVEQGREVRHAPGRGTRAERANLYVADLREADLSGTYLSVADLHGADLTGADLSHAKLPLSVFKNPTFFEAASTSRVEIEAMPSISRFAAERKD